MNDDDDDYCYYYYFVTIDMPNHLLIVAKSGKKSNLFFLLSFIIFGFICVLQMCVNTNKLAALTQSERHKTMKCFISVGVFLP